MLTRGKVTTPKHTEGPWEAHNGEITTRQQAGRSFRRIAVVQDYGLSGSLEVDEANARLIAEAPAMLRALKIARSMITSDMAHAMPEQYNEINAVLARINSEG